MGKDKFLFVNWGATSPKQKSDLADFTQKAKEYHEAGLNTEYTSLMEKINSWLNNPANVGLIIRQARVCCEMARGGSFYEELQSNAKVTVTAKSGKTESTQS